MSTLDLRAELKHPVQSVWLRPLVRVVFCLTVVVCGSTSQLQAQSNSTSIMGYVYDQSSKNAIPFANIVVLQDGQQVTGATTDLQGIFFIPRIKPASNYVLIASSVQHRTVQMYDCSVMSGNTTLVEFHLSSASDTLTPVIVSGSPSLFISEHFASAIRERVYSITSLRHGVQDNDGTVGSIRGTRVADTDTYIDGVILSGKTRIVEPVDHIPDILNGVPANMENHETVPKPFTPR